MDAVGCLPPPPFNRMPPDGHEFPQKYREEMPAAIQTVETKVAPPLPASEPPRRSLLEVLPNKTKVKTEWRQDERSGKSVRDKIAMFQSVPDAPVSPAGYSKLCKYKSSDDVFYDDEDRPLSKPFSRSVVSVDKLGGRKNSFSSTGDSGGEFGVRTQSSMDLTSCSSSAYSSSCSPDSSLSSTTSSYLGYSSTLPRKARTTETIKCESKPKAVTRTCSFNVHNRSQSMLDINPAPYGRPREEENQSSLNTMVEQRRKTMSKLRGLVIPERSSEPVIAKQPILDLPEIKSRDLVLNTTPSSEKERRTSVGCYPTYNPTPPTNLLSPPWTMQTQSPTIPKYSPAFKRKNISVYGSSNTDFSSRFISPVANAPNKPPRSSGFSPRYSLDSSKPVLPDSSTDIKSENHQRGGLARPNDFPKALDFYGRKSLSSDRSRSEEDSDNDSAVSSSRSSISPPASPLLGGHHAMSPLDVEKTPLVRTLSSETTASGTSTASTLTSGSHASCSSDSDSNSKRILKAQSVEAINRKNVLTSAKYSRGFDIKNGSPLIKRKLIEDALAEKLSNRLEGKEPSLPYDSYPNKYSNENTTNEIICYKLAEEYKTCNRVPEVKIAFLNHVEYEEVTDSIKKKVEKTESSPVSLTSPVPLPVPRRVSVPLCNTSPWTSEWNNSSHPPLTPKISSESVRSRASSADTIVEKPSALAAEIVPSRIRTVESEGNFLDDTVDFSTEESSPNSRPARSSTGSDSSPSAWGSGNFRISDTIEAESSVRPSESTPPVIHKRDSSGSLLESFEETVEVEKRGGRAVAERISARNRRSVSVNDIRKAFEKAEIALSSKLDKTNGTHARVSSLDSTTSDDSTAPYDCNLHREQFGSITSLASSTSLISPQVSTFYLKKTSQISAQRP